MNGSAFDRRVRRVITDASRRNLLAAAGVSALGAFGIASLRGADVTEAKRGGKKRKKRKQRESCKVFVCHKTGDPTSPNFESLEIACSAVSAHAAHGDTVCAPPPCRKFAGCQPTFECETCTFTALDDGAPCQDGDLLGTCLGGACAPPA